jgi:hypothetical protein
MLFCFFFKGLEKCTKKLGDVTTVNLTALKAGVPGNHGFQLNVVPGEAHAGLFVLQNFWHKCFLLLIGFDIRIPPSVDVKQFEKQLKEWCSEDEGVSFTFQVRSDPSITETSKHALFWVMICFSQLTHITKNVLIQCRMPFKIALNLKI